MRYHDIVCEQRIHNTGDLGQLETALALWGEGKTRQAQPLLLSLQEVAAPFAMVSQPMLYRGFLPSDEHWEQLRTTKRFSIKTPTDAPLASWSLSRAAVNEFMFGWEQPWVLIRKPTAELEIFINCPLFDRLARPFQHMTVQREVIVKMPSVMTVTRRDVTLHDR